MVSLPPCEHRRILQWYVQYVCVCVCVCVCVVEGKGRKGLFGHGILHTLSFVWFHSHHSFLLYNCLRLYVPWCAGQYYAQRVIGNYYIRKAQDYQKRGITRVDLHAS
jgi:hypothetical protein